ncbi:phage tail terminator-like protein [Psychrobacter sp. I-STPA6b]|uniref:phage tail terminator-like protein n=1 Tax=Psychrobacter sp. I-STPA6b TaxID=2585718 RepID=UPI001D0C1196|nr:phage tail terminator-like protein [Psychrobacter sp. I-STPA6b]
MADDLLLQHYISGRFGVPVALPNHSFDPKSMALWAKINDMPNRSRRANLCDVQNNGILQITLFCPVDTKTDIIDAKAEQIISHFGVEVQHKMGDKSLYVMSSYKSQGRPSGKWYMLPVTIEYQII